MPRLFTITQDANRYLASVDGAAAFEVGRRVIYPARGSQTIGLAGSRGATDTYNPAEYETQHGVWAYFIEPTGQCESNGRFATLNTYDIAFFTFGFLQFGAHVPNGDFLILFRRLLAQPEAGDYFPDLTVVSGRVCRIDPRGPVALESDISTQPLMIYLNPTTQAVEEIEAINAAKFVHWTSHFSSARELQVSTGVSLFRANLKAYAARYGLDGMDDTVCLVVCDIRHQGRGSSADILQALATKGDQKLAYANLIQIGSHLYGPRCTTLDAAIKAQVQAGKLGKHRYNVAQSDFVAK